MDIKRQLESKAQQAVIALSVLMVLAAALSAGHDYYVGTPYSKMTCSQFACLVTGHKPATAAQLYAEGSSNLWPLQDGDILCFHGAHVAVWTPDGMMDSTPERGVGLVTKINRNDLWYKGPIRIVRKP